MKYVRRGNALERQDHISDSRYRLGIEIGDITANHEADEFLLVDVRTWEGGDQLPITHDRDPVGDAEDLIQAVRDIQDSYALCRKIADNVKQLFDLLTSQRSGRLIHNHELRIERECLCNLNAFRPSNRRARHQSTRIDVQSNAPE